ncbi:MAG: UDP-4-amino-4,6-dideoxy-N-acetyl-beta-L-altrosamine transaminase [bacterium]|nr:UDP-4-amino-4,6-dideoxy-N-acetyl-beta-L-altrosamine transaminase [bacterium]
MNNPAALPYGRQWIDDDDIAAVVAVLQSDYITQGPVIAAFEQGICAVTGASFAVAVNSGTSALHIACRAAGVGVGDEVITSANTFLASANCVAYCGARPVFADIDAETYCINPDDLARKITERTKAIIPVHFAGQSCDMQAIAEIAREAGRRFGHKIWIIEDASHTLGSRYQDRVIGSCQYSDMAVLSFHPVKHITTGEGGAVLTNDPAVNEQLGLLRSHGMTKDPKVLSQQPGPWYYEQVELGYNYRITDIQCALGLSQLKKLPMFLERRRAIVERYNAAFGMLDMVRIPAQAPDRESFFHLYVLLFDFERIGKSRSQVMGELKDRGVLSQVHYIPVHLQPYYQRTFGTRAGDCPVAEWYYERCLSLPLFPRMTDEDVDRVINAVREVITL